MLLEVASTAPFSGLSPPGTRLCSRLGHPWIIWETESYEEDTERVGVGRDN